MSKHAFDPKCPHCRPMIIDPQTGQILPENHPVMVSVNRVFDAAPREQQEAFFRVVVENSRNPKDLKLLRQLQEDMEGAMKD